MFTLERASTRRSAGLISLVGLILLPLLLAAGFVFATWQSTDRLSRIQGAVVNLDEPVTLQGQLVPLGRQLAGGLVKGDEDNPDQNFSWTLTDADDAASGVASGRYAAVVTIPADFSARATSYADSDVDQVRPARIEVQTTAVSGLTDGVLGQVITETARRTLNTELTKSYLENIYVGFNDLNKQFGTLADASGKLADGTEQISGGLSRSAAGSAQLADGLGQLAGGADDLADGAGQLSPGVRQLADGLQQFADRTEQLPGQAKKLGQGSQQIATGVSGVADGAGQLADQLPAFAGGAGQLADGVEQYTGGVTRLSGGLSEVSDGLGTYAGGVGQYADGAASYATGVAALADGMEQIAGNGLPCPADLSAEACEGYRQGARAAAGAAVQGLRGTDQQPGLVAGAQGLAAGARQLDSGAAQLDSAIGRLADGAGQLAGSGPELSSGATALAEGAGKISTGTQGLADGLDKLAPGAQQIADGTVALANGLPRIQSGIADSADGADQLADGVAGLSSGLSQYADGVGQSADGADALATGLQKLAAGTEDLADGSRRFADGVAEGQDKVPTYTKAERTQLASVVSTPVESEQPDSLFANQATTTYLAMIALWIGALATYLVVRAVTGRALLSSRPSWRLALEGLAPGAAIGAVQALALTVALQRLLDLDAGAVARLLPFALLVAVTFAAVNQALVAWFGGVGRFVSAGVLILAAAAAITSAVPEFFDAVLPLLPTTPALAGLRAVVTGAPGVGSTVVVLLGWLIVALLAGIGAVARRRTLPALS